MSACIEALPIEFPSNDGKSTLHGTIWMPQGQFATNSKGIVQIVHGMAEHHGRYSKFGIFLARNGYVACAHDHIGHGEGADAIGQGNMDAKHGERHMIEDVDELRRIASQNFPGNVPYFIFGHSMGSLVVRVYISKHGQGLAGAIICGTAHEPVIVSGAGNILARTIAMLRGNECHSNLLHSLADGAYSRAVKEAETPLDWLSVNKQNVKDYMEDSLSGFMFTAGGYATLTALARDAALNKTFERIPKSLPMLFIAGSEDPVGKMGRGVKRAVSEAISAGIADTELILYEGMRHEILNEADNQKVYDDVLEWLNNHVL